MLLEKSLEKLGKHISTLTFAINEEIIIGFDNFSGCEYDDYKIVVGLYPIENDIDKHHAKYYIKNGFDYTKYGISFETFTLLHEIGHIESKPKERYFKQYYKEREKINNNVKFNEEPLNETLSKYYRLKLEVLADKWAFKFLKNNIEEIKSFDKKYIRLRKELLESE